MTSRVPGRSWPSSAGPRQRSCPPPSAATWRARHPHRRQPRTAPGICCEGRGELASGHARTPVHRDRADPAGHAADATGAILAPAGNRCHRHHDQVTTVQRQAGRLAENFTGRERKPEQARQAGARLPGCSSTAADHSRPGTTYGRPCRKIRQSHGLHHGRGTRAGKLPRAPTPRTTMRPALRVTLRGRRRRQLTCDTRRSARRRPR